MLPCPKTFPSFFVPFYFLSFLMLIYSFITDYQEFSFQCKDNTTRDKNETKVGKQSANLGKNNEPIQNRILFLIDCKSVILHHLTILSFPMVRPAWDNWWLLLVNAVFSFLRHCVSGWWSWSWGASGLPPDVMDVALRLPLCLAARINVVFVGIKDYFEHH